MALANERGLSAGSATTKCALLGRMAKPWTVKPVSSSIMNLPAITSVIFEIPRPDERSVKHRVEFGKELLLSTAVVGAGLLGLA